MKIDLNRIIIYLLLVILIISVLKLSYEVKESSKIGRFQISGGETNVIIDTKTGETKIILPKGFDGDTSLWNKFPSTEKIITD